MGKFMNYEQVRQGNWVKTIREREGYKKELFHSPAAIAKHRVGPGTAREDWCITGPEGNYEHLTRIWPSVSWQSAKNIAEMRGGKLLTFDSDEKWNHFMELVKAEGLRWRGLAWVGAISESEPGAGGDGRWLWKNGQDTQIEPAFFEENEMNKNYRFIILALILILTETTKANKKDSIETASEIYLFHL